MGQSGRFLFFADSGAEVGGGHVMRCLTLAQALLARGARCAFIGPPHVRDIVRTFGPIGIEIFPVPDAGTVDEAVAQAGRAAQTFEPVWVVIDHYRTTFALEAALRAPGRRLAVLDDLAEQRRDCDLLISPSHGRAAGDYERLVPAEAIRLVGAEYALVRPEFQRARAAALLRRGQGPVTRVLISLGLTDVGGITGRVVAAVAARMRALAFDIVLGDQAPSRAAITALAAARPSYKLHIESKAMAELMTGADLAIGAGGSSTWERCCLGLPTLTLVLADNQLPLAQRLHQEGVTLAVDARASAFEARLMTGLDRLLADQTLRAQFSQRGALLCDGRGAERAAAKLLEL